jgi:hypothetical protein
MFKLNCKNYKTTVAIHLTKKSIATTKKDNLSFYQLSAHFPITHPISMIKIIAFVV